GVSEEVTVPRSGLPPSRTTASVKRFGEVSATRSTVLPARPPDVAVIVVVPGPRAVATPVASIVATVGSLLAHVAPIPTTVTGAKASPSGLLRSRPSPSRPNRPRPQHCTRPSWSTAHVCSAPELAVSAVVSPVTAAVGGLKIPRGLPLPFCAKPLSPQQRMLPSRRSAQLCSAPGAITAGFVMPLTVSGVDDAFAAGGSFP